MKIWTSEHVFNHNWDTVVQSQFRKYPNPHNTAVLGTDVYDRRVDPKTGILHSHRIITSGKPPSRFKNGRGYLPKFKVAMSEIPKLKNV